MTLLAETPPAYAPAPSRDGVVLRESDQFEGRRLRRINVRSVMVVAAVFNAVIAMALFVAGWIVIGIAASRGVFDGVNPPDSLHATSGGGLSADHLTWVWAAITVGWAVMMTAVAGLATV